jgi:hypothetical protein
MEQNVRKKLFFITLSGFQDEKLKKDADNILSNVLRKKNEAGNRIQLLDKLEKLHTARHHAMGVDAWNSGFINVIGVWRIKRTLSSMYE